MPAVAPVAPCIRAKAHTGVKTTDTTHSPPIELNEMVYTLFPLEPHLGDYFWGKVIRVRDQDEYDVWFFDDDVCVNISREHVHPISEVVRGFVPNITSSTQHTVWVGRI